MPLTNPYCQVTDVRSQLTDADAQLDQAMIERAINATSRAIDRYCGRRFWQDPAPVARKYRPARWNRVDVDDISTTTDLVVETSPTITWDSPIAWTLDTDFELSPDNADADEGAFAWWRITAVGTKTFSCERFRSVRVTARWGWSEVPDEVTQAAILKAVSLFKRKDAPFGVAGFGEFGAVRITRKDPDVIDMLSAYQKPMAA